MTKTGSLVGQRIDYNGVGALRGQRGLCPAKIYPSTLPGEKAKFMNLEINDRAIEHKPSTKLLGVHVDEPGIIKSKIFHLKSLIACECCI